MYSLSTVITAITASIWDRILLWYGLSMVMHWVLCDNDFSCSASVISHWLSPYSCHSNTSEYNRSVSVSSVMGTLWWKRRLTSATLSRMFRSLPFLSSSTKTGSAWNSLGKHWTTISLFGSEDLTCFSSSWYSSTSKDTQSSGKLFR